LDVSLESVLSICQEPYLNITEVEFFHCLLMWGEANTKGKNETIRSKIDECIREVRFCSLSAEDFCALFEHSDCLSVEEKWRILLEIKIPRCSHLPEGFSALRYPRNFEAVSYQWLPGDFVDVFGATDLWVGNPALPPPPSKLILSMNEAHYVLGLELSSLAGLNKGKYVDIEITVKKSGESDKILGKGGFKGKCDSLVHCPFDVPVLLHGNVPYTFEVNYLNGHPTKVQTMKFHKERDDSTMTFAENKFQVSFETLDVFKDIFGLCVAKYQPKI
jgi:hypothetical protein